MSRVVSNTSPLLYLYHAGGLLWLPEMFEEIWVPDAVRVELLAGKRLGYDIPTLTDYPWLQIVQPSAFPSEWLAVDLGRGELAALSVALDDPECIILLDDLLARRIAKAAGLNVWGTLRVVLEAKTLGLIDEVVPVIDRLRSAGMWISVEVRQRILVLAREGAE